MSTLRDPATLAPGSRISTRPSTPKISADVLTRDQMEFLSREEQPFCVSVFLPTHRAGKETEQDAIRLKQLLNKAEEELIAQGLPKVKSRNLLTPFRQLQHRTGFWRIQSDGLALFGSPSFAQYFRLPMSFKESVSVSRRFQIKPLLPLFTASGRFYVLALSKKRVQLFQGTQYGMDEVELFGVPRSMNEILQYEVHEGQYSVHSSSGAPSGAKKEKGVFYGFGGDVDAAKSKMLDYFHAVNKGLRKFLHPAGAPLLLAAVEEWFPLYRLANSYVNLLQEGIPGNWEHTNPKQLHDHAWNIVERHFAKARAQVLADYMEGVGTGKATNVVHEALRAAYDGRIRSVILPANVERWGRFDPATNELEMHNPPQPGDEDLLNLIAVQTILNSGALFAVPAAEMPGDSLVAAVYRY